MSRLKVTGLLWGIGAGALYLAVLWSAWPSPLPQRLLFDGYTPPPPYRWVRPPRASPQPNQPPQSGRRLIALTPSGSAPGFVATGDDQTGVVFPTGAFGPEAGEQSVEIRITPLDPAAIAPAPRGLRYDANAYRIDATYAVSHRPAALHAPVSIVLRYATGATALLHLSRSTWTTLPSQPVVLSSQIYASTRTLGVFAAAGPLRAGPPISAWLYRGLTVTLGILAAVALAWVLRDRTGRRRRGPRGRGRMAAAPAPRPPAR